MVSDYYLIDLFNAYFNYQVKSYNLYKFFNPENNIRISDIKSEFKKFSEKYDVDFTNNQIPTMTTLKSLSSKSYKYWQVDRYDQKTVSLLR